MESGNLKLHRHDPDVIQKIHCFGGHSLPWSDDVKGRHQVEDDYISYGWLISLQIFTGFEQARPSLDRFYDKTCHFSALPRFFRVLGSLAAAIAAISAGTTAPKWQVWSRRLYWFKYQVSCMINSMATFWGLHNYNVALDIWKEKLRFVIF